MSWGCSLGRNFWHRSGYFGTVLCLVGSLYSLPNTPLLLDDGQLDWESSSFLAVCAFAAAVSFLLLQGSDPGYLDARTLREAEQSQSLLRREGEDGADEEAGALSTAANDRLRQRPSKGGLLASERGDDFCEICRVVPLLRSHHCRSCGRCVASFDHHCPCLGTCIGERNVCRFWWFLFFQATALWVANGMVFEAFTPLRTFRSAAEWLDTNSSQIGLCLVFSILGCFVSGLLAFQSWLAATNTTGFEIRRPERLPYLKGFHDCDLPFSRGLNRNLEGFCCLRDGCCAGAFSTSWSPRRYKQPEQIDRYVPSIFLVHGESAANVIAKMHKRIDKGFNSMESSPFHLMNYQRLSDGGTVVLYGGWVGRGALRIVDWLRAALPRTRLTQLPSPSSRRDSDDWWENWWENKYWSCC